MSRPAHARRRVMNAARKLVLAHGARSLTFEALAEASGVTRSGIFYHWPSRQALVRGLLEDDLEAWDQRCRDLSTEGDLALGYIRCNLEPQSSVGTLAASLFPEAREDNTSWERVRQSDRTHFSDWSWDDKDLDRYLLVLASEAVFWRRLNGLAPDVPDLETRLKARIERGLAEIDNGAPSQGEIQGSHPGSGRQEVPTPRPVHIREQEEKCLTT